MRTVIRLRARHHFFCLFCLFVCLFVCLCGLFSLTFEAVPELEDFDERVRVAVGVHSEHVLAIGRGDGDLVLPAHARLDLLHEDGEVDPAPALGVVGAASVWEELCALFVTVHPAAFAFVALPEEAVEHATAVIAKGWRHVRVHLEVVRFLCVL